MAKFSKSDNSVAVIIGSGAGGGVLGMELALKGIKTVILEAGGRHNPQDFVNDEWASFGQISWLDKGQHQVTGEFQETFQDYLHGSSKPLEVLLYTGLEQV